jgi:hypothetical protein
MLKVDVTPNCTPIIIQTWKNLNLGLFEKNNNAQEPISLKVCERNIAMV